MISVITIPGGVECRTETPGKCALCGSSHYLWRNRDGRTLCLECDEAQRTRTVLAEVALGRMSADAAVAELDGSDRWKDLDARQAHDKFGLEDE